MSNCVVCLRDKLNARWTAQAREFVCSKECAAIHSKDASLIGLLFILLFVLILLLIQPIVFLVSLPVTLPAILWLYSRINLAWMYGPSRLQDREERIMNRKLRSAIDEKHLREEGITHDVEVEKDHADPALNSTHLLVEELNSLYRMCCYQTARLQEKYCICGRAVDTQLQKHLVERISVQ